MTQAVSRREYAKRRGISEAAVRKHIASGALADALTTDGLIDPVVADRLLAKHLTRGASEPVMLKTAKARRQRARVRRQADVVDDLRRTLITPADAAAIRMEDSGPMLARFRKMAEEAGAVAGMDATAAHAKLRDLVNEALADISGEPAPATEEVAPDEPIDIDSLTPSSLAAHQANLEAEEMERQRALGHGHFIDLYDAVKEYEEALGMAKSIITAMPGRVAPLASALTAEEVRSLVLVEVERAGDIIRGGPDVAKSAGAGGDH